jgi:hypothetical protein
VVNACTFTAVWYTIAIAVWSPLTSTRFTCEPESEGVDPLVAPLTSNVPLASVRVLIATPHGAEVVEENPEEQLKTCPSAGSPKISGSRIRIRLNMAVPFAGCWSSDLEIGAKGWSVSSYSVSRKESGWLRGRSFQAMRWLAMIQREVTGAKLLPVLGHSQCSFDLGVQAASGTTSCRNDPYPSHPKKPKELTSPEKQSTISRVAFGVTSNKQVRSEHHLDVGRVSISSALSSTKV